MADLGHLEKMGRELKCPICLSLLKSAASLGCNHIFCNLCILESMKSGSNCPVCKVPFHRREVRPAPHMDNLVSIYKTMELASGVNIFATQVGPPAKHSVMLEDGVDQGGCKNSGTCVTKVAHGGKPKAKGFPGKQRQQSEKADIKSLSKKRVHVTPYPVSETPMRPEKVSKVRHPNTEPEDKRGSEENEMVVTEEQGDPCLTPFFWLREDNDDDEVPEKLSTQLTDDAVLPQNPTCFSDIKDSDDDSALVKVTPTSKEAFDSELFEWSQRACSPELCSTPLRKQTAGRHRLAGIQEKNDQTDSKKEKKPNRKGRRNHAKTPVRRSGSSEFEVPPEVLVDPGERLKNPNKKSKDSEIMRPKSLGMKGGKTHNKSSSHYQFKDSLTTEAISVRNKKEEMKDAQIVSPLLPSLEKTSHSVPNVNTRSGKRGKRDIVEFQRKHMNKESQKDLGKLKNRKSEQVADVAVARDATKLPFASMERPQCENNLHSFVSLSAKNSSVAKSFDSLSRNILKKCTSVHSPIQCAFCQSSEDTKVSGEMMHYFSGKPVAADYNGGLDVVHSHKYCTEWAPDVYFDDDVAINLSAELARSRRLKCSYCGIKGAALGCYEKSCRKSFHFTCGKLTPECRWDHENFVMLCPLHSSSKLPSETLKPQKQHKKRSTLKVESNSIVSSRGDTTRKWTWPSGCPCKWFLCCSALTAAEKEIVSEFTKLTGISVSKTWVPAVTHVIASTDEHGACKRTLKFLMGILDGKWILNINWIKACMEAMMPVNEEKYEIRLDTHGISGGPQLGRLRIIKKQPKLFNGFRFYFTGDFQPSYKGYLNDLVVTAGGTVLQRKPISRDREKILDDSPLSETFVVYELEVPENCEPGKDSMVLNHRRAQAQSLADACGAKVVGNSWIVDSIAACRVQLLT